jgi:5-methylcytosine-specific restriction endonuclease McrA
MKAKEVYARVRERDQHRCQYPLETDARGDTWRKCGTSSHTEAHHRRIRGQGGLDTEENLILLCKTHHDLVHADPNEAREMGLIVQDGDTESRHHWMDSSIPEDGYFDDENAAFSD